MDGKVLQIRNLGKSFGKTMILQGIDFDLPAGEVYGLVGQNGAGNTTLLRIISGLMKPSKGIVTINTMKKYLGYMPQSCRFDDRSSVTKLFPFFKS